MRPLRAIFVARFRVLLQYRAAALAGVGTQLFFGLVLTSALGAFYASADFATTGAPPLSLSQAVTYIWLGQATLGILPWRMDAEVRAMIASGGIANELLKPIDLQKLWLARAVALRTAPVLLRAAPLLVVALLFFGLKPPPDATAAAFWLLGLLGAVALSAALTVIINISMLWTLSGDGMSFLVPALATLLSGQLLPLPLFPDWAQTALAWQPFRGLMDTPHRLWLGDLGGSEAWAAIAHQWAWVAVLCAGSRWVLRRGLRRVVVQGG